MKLALYIISLVIISSCTSESISGTSKSDKDSSIVVSDSLNNDSDTKDIVIDTVHSDCKIDDSLYLNETTNKSALFPYSEVDSAVFISYNQDRRNPVPTVDSLPIKKVIILCKDKCNAILNFVNNPANFGYGECGTFDPNSQIVLFNKGIQVGTITMGCGYSQWFMEPESKLTKHGGLTQEGSKKLDHIAPWR